jgi:hypothetical protein
VGFSASRLSCVLSTLRESPYIDHIAMLGRDDHPVEVRHNGASSGRGKRNRKRLLVTKGEGNGLSLETRQRGGGFEFLLVWAVSGHAGIVGACLRES